MRQYNASNKVVVSVGKSARSLLIRVVLVNCLVRLYLGSRFKILRNSTGELLGCVKVASIVLIYFRRCCYYRGGLDAAVVAGDRRCCYYRK